MTNYTATAWVDDVPVGTGTPVNAANMNKLEGGAAAALAQASVFTAGTNPYQNKLAITDAQPAFRFYGDGKHEWGPGGTSVVDVNLYRSGVNALKTDQAFRAETGLTSGANVFLASDSGRLYFGAASDTNLYRGGSAGLLKTDGRFVAGGDILANAALPASIYLAADGKIYFGPANDTNLYRSGVGTLRTDSSLGVGASLIFGSDAVLTRFYRIGLTPAGAGYAGILATDGAFYLAGPQCVLRVGTQDSGDLGSGGNDRAIYLMDTGRIPAGPTTGGYLYSVNGSLYWRGLTNTSKLIIAG